MLAAPTGNKVGAGMQRDKMAPLKEQSIRAQQETVKRN
jgi:hypothetical protein